MTQPFSVGSDDPRPGGATALYHATEDVGPIVPSLTRRRMALLMPAGLLAACQAPRPDASGSAGAGDAHAAMAAGPTASRARPSPRGRTEARAGASRPPA